MSTAELAAHIQQIAYELREHCDSVQIHASIVEDNQTKGIHRGCGDWYARQGLAREFIEQDQAETIGEACARHAAKED